jgi:hypothetical protein
MWSCQSRYSRSVCALVRFCSIGGSSSKPPLYEGDRLLLVAVLEELLPVDVLRLFVGLAGVEVRVVRGALGQRVELRGLRRAGRCRRASGLGDVVGEDGVAVELLADLLHELEPRELQQADRLHQLRRHHELLRHLDLELHLHAHLSATLPAR